jgi:hypothetical protein
LRVSMDQDDREAIGFSRFDLNVMDLDVGSDKGGVMSPMILLRHLTKLKVLVSTIERPDVGEDNKCR